MKNIRIQIKSSFFPRSNQLKRCHSDSKVKTEDKLKQKKLHAQKHYDQTTNVRSYSIVGILNHLKANQIQPNHSKLLQSKKRLLKLQDKNQNIIKVTQKQHKIKSQSLSLNHQQMEQQDHQKQNKLPHQKTNVKPQILVSKRSKRQPKIIDQKYNLLEQKQFNQKNSHLISSQKLYQQNRKNDSKIIYPELISQFLSQINIKSKQIHIHLNRITSLKLSHQVSIKIPSSSLSTQTFPQPNSHQQKKSIGIQVSTYSLQDKYYHEYVRLRQLKVKHFEQVQQKQNKINQMIEQSNKFSKNYQHLLDFLNDPPFDDREKRIYALGKQLQEAQKITKQAFQKVQTAQKQSHTHLQTHFPSIQHKKDELAISIFHLLKVLALKISKNQSQNANFEQNNQKKQKSPIKNKIQDRLILRIFNQLKYYRQIDLYLQKKTHLILQNYHKQVLGFSQSYKKWLGMIYENRVLIYNFMCQIKKLPNLMIKLFGYKAKQKDHQPKSSFDNYMSTKCEQCYHMNKKVKCLQEAAEHIKPVLKCFQWLIRDVDKKRTCISII